MSSTVLFFGSIALFYFLIMIPIQYLYLQGLHEKKKKQDYLSENYTKECLLEKNNYIFMCKATHLIYHLRLSHI
ncbi:hypothetical protein BF37_2433 [Bacillus anthracis]|nr:hypothetical protein BF37_2433 [Bacillus anthracis]